MPVVPELGRQRMKDLEFKASLGILGDRILKENNNNHMKERNENRA